MTDDDNATAKTMIGNGTKPPEAPAPPAVAPPAQPAVSQATVALPPSAVPSVAASSSPEIAATLPPTMPPQLAPDAQTAAGTPAKKKAAAGGDGSGYESWVGKELGGYTIKRKLAEGGMGVVFEGEHGKLGRKGAIKLLKLEFCQNDEVVERFYQEARAVNSIRHENIVDIFDFGRDPDGRVFFVMEFLEGEPLSSRIRKGALPWKDAFPILEQTLRALKAAHDKGFVHRDLKPDNIWLKTVDGKVEVKLLDFGIAKLVGAEEPKEKLTRTGSIMGTPHYMSPEQINGSKDIDLRTDIYAMGVITYEMFAGKTPFLGDTLQAIMTGHLFTEPPRLDDVPTDHLGVPKPLAEIIDRMLVKDPADRYASASEVLADLRAVNRNEEPTRAETLKKDKPTRKSKPVIAAQAEPARSVAEPATAKRSPLIYVGIGAVVLAAGALAITKLGGGSDNPAQPQPAASSQPSRPTQPSEPATPPPPKPIDYDQVRKDAQTTLRASLQEAEPAVRVAGTDALGKIKDQPSVPALTSLTQSDPDAETRGHAAGALGEIGAAAAVAILQKLEPAAPPPLKVWYASALAHLGDKAAKKRLLQYAGDKDLKVSFKAALALADVSQPGDADTIKALRVLAGHEAELNDIAPYAGAVILTKMAALHDAQARKILYSLLDAKDEGSRLAAAEGLAKLGDDAGKKVLEDVYGNEASPNRLVASAALVPLGDYVGFDLLTQRLADKDAETRRLAARGLGDIGERKSVPALLALVGDKDWTVRISAAVALMAIVGLDPAVLAQASVDWTKSALQSEDWAVRKAAAGVLGDMPEKDAVPLLASAIADPDPNVRLAASHSAGKMKGADAANSVASAAKSEKDPKVKEDEVKALGEIGNPVAHDTLVSLEAEPGHVGVFAAGSLIAVGDPAGKAKLDAAVAAPQADLRLAAVQSASEAKNPIVVPTLVVGVGDKVFDVKFTAAEGLAGFHAEKAAAVPVLTAGLDSKDASVQGRAEAALLELGEKPPGNAPSPADMIDSPDAKVRLAAIPAIAELPPAEAAPLLRRVVGDVDQDVRRAGVDAIQHLVPKDKGTAIQLYKPLVQDADPVVRSKSQGELSRLVDAPPKTASLAPAPPAAGSNAASPQLDGAVAEAGSAANDAKIAAEAVDASAKAIVEATAAPAKDDAAVKHAAQLATDIDTAAKAVEDDAARAEAAANNAASLAGSAIEQPDINKVVTDAKASATAARASATAARTAADAAAKKARDYAKSETEDPQLFVAAADAAIATGNLGEAKHDLDRAAKAGGARPAGLDYSYAQLYDKQARGEKDPAAKKRLLEEAKASYEAFAKTGAGARAQRATARAQELADELKDLAAP
jgi:serine/threonine-protein kinase|nr:HEAT repeat domain-containing protein [Kofleriaceae bacterium]